MIRAAPPFRIGGPAAASLLVNALLIAALLNLGMGHVRQRKDAPGLTVMSLALLRGSEQGAEEAEAAVPEAAASPTPPPATPMPAPQPAVAATVPPASVSIPSRIALPTPVQAAAAAPTPTTAGAQQARPSAAANSPPAAPPARRGAADALDIKAPAGTSRSYAAKVRSWLYAHKIYPRRARMRREEGQVEVRFVLDRAGILLEGAIVHGSGNPVLDEEAEAMMRRASPYPRAPDELPGDRIEFTAPIAFLLPT